MTDKRGARKRLVPRVRVAMLVAVVAGVTAIPVTAPAAAPVTNSSIRVPRLIGKKLPLAEVLIRRAGLHIGKEDCDCTFGVVVKSNWYVCIQWPRAGRLVARGTRVATYSVRYMSDC